MKGIKVIDVGTNPEEVEFGTCEICFSYGMADNPYIVLEFPGGTQVTIETYYWDFGVYWESSVDNVIDFSAWLSERDFTEEEVKNLKSGGKHALIRLITEYNWQLEETDE